MVTTLNLAQQVAQHPKISALLPEQKPPQAPIPDARFFLFCNVVKEMTGMNMCDLVPANVSPPLGAKHAYQLPDDSVVIINNYGTIHVLEDYYDRSSKSFVARTIAHISRWFAQLHEQQKQAC